VLLKSFGVPADARWWVYGAIALVTLAGLYVAAARAKRKGDVDTDAETGASVNA
jgi:hypothetical protein